MARGKVWEGVVGKESWMAELVDTQSAVCSAVVVGGEE